jgi:acyl-homoserine lactone synthase
MILVVRGAEIQRFSNEMEQAYRLRHRVFVDEMKWDALRRPDGRELDNFDDEHALHMLALEGDRVVGYQRMLPTTRPHLLSSEMPELCEVDLPVGPHIWEWTRYCVEKTHRERGRILSPTANMLLSAIVDWGLDSGVTSLVIEMDPLWLLRLVQLHFRVTPLGLPRVMNGQEVLAVVASFDKRTAERLMQMRTAIPAAVRDQRLSA